MSIRKTLLVGGAVFLALAGASVCAFLIAYNNDLYTAQPGPSPNIVIRGGTLFAGTGHVPTKNSTIVVRNGLITCIGTKCEAPAGAIEIDATDHAILPGMIDLHGHFFGFRDRPSLPSLIWSTIRLRPDFRRAMLEAGVTSFRSVGDPRDAILDLKRKLNRRELAGPRMFVAGPIVTAPGGHPTYRGRDPNPGGFGGAMTFQSNDPLRVATEVSLLASQGVDGIKAVFHGRAATPDRPALPTLSVQTLRALTQAAGARGLWVAVHVGPQDETKKAVRSGATTIEHGVRNGHLIDAETLQTLVANDAVYVPTLGREPEGHLNIPALVKAGVAIGVGTDGEDYNEELSRLVAAGMSPSAVLLAATANGAKAIRRLDTLGTIQTRKIADIVIVNGAPWRDIGDMRSTIMVIQAGYIVLDRR